MIDIFNHLSKKLHTYLRENNMTEREFAKVSGLSIFTIKSILQKKAKAITVKKVFLLART